MTRYRELLFCLAFLPLAACHHGDDPRAEAAPAGTSRGLVEPARIDAALAGFVERGELVGVSALVYEDGEEAYFGAFGLADRESGSPMRRDTLVRIYSMTKPITGVTLMSLYEEGLFDLDDPLAKYLPEFASVRVFAGDEGGAPVLVEPSRPPTIRDILRHTAGFGNDDSDEWLARRYTEADILAPDNSLQELSQRLAGVPLEYHPGTRWHYGPSVDVQARLVEVLTAQPFADVMRERVLDPLGMSETRYRLQPGQLGRFAAIYERDTDGTFKRIDAYNGDTVNISDWTLTPGGWGLASTLDDYMRFARMLLGEGALGGVQILEPETVRLMATDAMPATVTDRAWLPGKGQVGFGIDFAVRIAPPADNAENSGAVGEFFWDGAANTLFWVDPANDIVAVLFVQYVPFGPPPVQKAFRDAVYFRDDVASALNKPPRGAE